MSDFPGLIVEISPLFFCTTKKRGHRGSICCGPKTKGEDEFFVMRLQWTLTECLFATLNLEVASVSF